MACSQLECGEALERAAHVSASKRVGPSRHTRSELCRGVEKSFSLAELFEESSIQGQRARTYTHSPQLTTALQVACSAPQIVLSDEHVFFIRSVFALVRLPLVQCRLRQSRGKWTPARGVGACFIQAAWWEKNGTEGFSIGKGVILPLNPRFLAASGNIWSGWQDWTDSGSLRKRW